MHRSLRELEAFIDVVEAAKAKVVTVQAGTLDLATASGRMTARLVGAVARHESEHKAERQRAQIVDRAKAGRNHGGRRAFGYEPDGMTVRRVEADIVASMVADLLAGGTFSGVIRKLDAAGIKTSGGKDWRATTVRALVTGPRIAGLRRHQGNVLGDAAWPAIVDRGDWEALRAILNDPSRRLTKPRRRYLLTGGLARCGRCGEPMAGKPHRGQPTLRCPAPPAGHGCGGVRIQAAPLEAHVVTSVFRHVDELPLRKAVESAPVAPALDDQIAVLEEQLRELVAMWKARTIDAVSWAEGRRLVEADLVPLRAKMAAGRRHDALRDVAGIPGALAEQWLSMDLDRRRYLLDQVLVEVTIGPGVRGRNHFDPGRVTPVWR